MMDDTLVCPYDPSHNIHILRMPRHLLRCRKNHPDVELSVCPFNGYHEVPTPELRYHMEHCPDKALLDRDLQLGFTETKVKGYTELPRKRDHRLHNDDDELWESEEEENSFDSQRNWQRCRMRRGEEDTRLRLPNREGIAARLASSLLAVENSSDEPRAEATHHTLSNSRHSTDIEPDRIQGRRCVEQVSDPTQTHQVSARLNSSPSQSDHSCHSTSQIDPQSQRAQFHSQPQTSRTSTPASLSVTQSKGRDPSGSALTSTGISRLSLEPSSGTQQDFTATSKCQKVQSEPERALPVTKYPAFMLGRGRAMPSFMSNSSLNQRTVGRGAAVNSLATEAQSKRLMLLAHSLGRGRNLDRTSNPA